MAYLQMNQLILQLSLLLLVSAVYHILQRKVYAHPHTWFSSMNSIQSLLAVGGYFLVVLGNISFILFNRVVQVYPFNVAAVGGRHPLVVDYHHAGDCRCSNHVTLLC